MLQDDEAIGQIVHQVGEASVQFHMQPGKTGKSNKKRTYPRTAGAQLIVAQS